VAFRKSKRKIFSSIQGLFGEKMPFEEKIMHKSTGSSTATESSGNKIELINDDSLASYWIKKWTLFVARISIKDFNKNAFLQRT
jgi:hypothetical protein